jgi:hypothetical protein
MGRVVKSEISLGFPDLVYNFHMNSFAFKSRCGCMVVGFTTTCAISAYHHYSCEFEPRSWWGVLKTTLCDKSLIGRWFSPGIAIFSNNKTDRHDITEILLKVALNTINSNTVVHLTLSESRTHNISGDRHCLHR